MMSLRFILGFSLVMLFAVPAQAERYGMQHYRSDIGWASFDYPQGWFAAPTERSSGRFWDNFGIQPTGQNFSGRSGEVAIRIFDPMYVIEQSRLTGSYTWTDLFRRFLNALGASNAIYGQQTVGGRFYYTATVDDGGFETDYVAFTSANGYLDVVGVAGAPREASQNRDFLYAVAGSLSHPGPNRQLTEPEIAVRDWQTALKRSDPAALMDLSCAAARPLLALTGLGALLFGGRDSLAVLSALYRNYDFSNLRYQTLNISGDGSAVAVRTAGNLVVPGGGVAPYTGSRNFGDSNVVIVRREEGQWRVCEPVRGGNR